MLSCNVDSTKIYDTTMNKNSDSLTQKIKFDFSAKYFTGRAGFKFDSLIDVDLKFDSLLEVDASLFNSNSDTIYFLHSTCNGTQFLLNYDSSKFTLTPIQYCNVSWVMLEKIAPNAQFNFIGYFKNKTKQTQIKLCFDFIRVDKSFDVSKIKLRDINRTQNDQNLICAEEKLIQE
jgi:hypothetical protein